MGLPRGGSITDAATHTAGLSALAEALAAAVAAERALVLASRRGRLGVVARHPAAEAGDALDPAALRAIGAALEAGEPAILEDAPGVLGGAALLLLPLRDGDDLVGAIVLADSPMPPSAALEMLAGALPLATAHVQTWLELDSAVRETPRGSATSDLLRQATEMIPSPARLIDIEGRILVWNKACEELYGWTQDEVLGTVLPTVVPERRAVVFADLRRMAETMQPLERETAQVRKDGSRIMIGLGLYPVVDERGQFFALTVTRNLHEDSRLDRLRDDFCDLVSSSLKAPLTAITGFTQLLRRSEIVEDRVRRQRVLDALHAQSGLLSTMIDDLLLVSQVREGALKLDRAPADLVAAVTECVGEAERAYPGRRFVVDVDGRLPRANVDRHRLRQALLHLLGNAATYSSIDGEIWVTVSREHAEGVVAVRDRGEGIPAEDMPRVFERFARGSRARGAGAGVGLYLTRLIAEAHGGSVALESQADAGCRAILRLPLD